MDEICSNENKKQGGGKGNIVLGVYIHCPGCAEAVRKCLKGYNGVETVEVDSVKNRVTVKGEKADPDRIAKRLRKKTGKHVDLISPIPPKESKKEGKKEDKKEPKVVEVQLKVYLHCEGCATSVKRSIHKMPGVQTVETDMEKNLVKVKGAIEAQKLVEFVIKKEGKHAEIAKPENKKKKNGEGGEGEEGQKEKEGKKKNWYDDLTPDMLYAPQLFSDENPNSCSVM